MPSPLDSAPPPRLREAVSHARSLLKGIDGVIAVKAGQASIIVYVRGGDAAQQARSTVGVTHKGHPVTFRSGMPSESAGILTVYPKTAE